MSPLQLKIIQTQRRLSHFSECIDHEKTEGHKIYWQIVYQYLYSLKILSPAYWGNQELPSRLTK